MKQHAILTKQKLPMAVLWALTLAALAVEVSFAAYTNFGYKKGVVTTNGTSRMFSSNVLSPYTPQELEDNKQNEEAAYIYRFIKDENAAADKTETAGFSIYNHSAENPLTPNPQDIYYDIQFTLISKTGTPLAGTYSVSDGSSTKNFENEKVEFSNCYLPGERLSSNTFEIKFWYAEIEDCAVAVRVTPSDPASKAAVSNICLYRKLQAGLQEPSAGTGKNWKGSLTKAVTNSTTAPDYSGDSHAFNYLISGTSGSGRFTLTWNANYVYIDPLFCSTDTEGKITGKIADDTYDAKLKTDEASGNRSLSFLVDAAEESYYNIQFYRIGSAVDSESWTTVESWFSYEILADTEEELKN